MTPAVIKHLKSYYGWQRRCYCCMVPRKHRKQAHKRLRPWLRAKLRKGDDE